MPSDDPFPIAELRGHGDAIAGLWRAAAAERLPHALLITGSEGVGKFSALRVLTAGLMCAQGPGAPCLSCGPCKRLRTAQHPDVFTVDARASGQDQLTIAFIAQRDTPSGGTGYKGPAVADFLELRAQEGGWRVVLVREAERLNEQAQNAFLKTLEEPGRRTLIAMETSQPARLLQTILSRVVRLELGALNDADCAAVLEGSGVPAAELPGLVRLSRGAPGWGLTLRAQRVPEMRDLLLQSLRGVSGVVETRMALWTLEGDYPGKTAAAEHRSRASAFLDLGLDLMRDEERLAAGAALDDLAHGDVLGDLPRQTEAQRRTRLDRWLAARQDIALNLAPDGLVDRALAAVIPAPLAAPKRR